MTVRIYSTLPEGLYFFTLASACLQPTFVCHRTKRYLRALCFEDEKCGKPPFRAALRLTSRLRCVKLYVVLVSVVSHTGKMRM